MWEGMQDICVSGRLSAETKENTQHSTAKDVITSWLLYAFRRKSFRIHDTRLSRSYPPLCILMETQHYVIDN